MPGRPPPRTAGGPHPLPETRSVTMHPEQRGARRSRRIWYAVGTVAALSVAALVPAATASATTIPANTGSVPLSATKVVNGSYDGGMKRFYGVGDLGNGGQAEGQDPLFDLPDGGTLKN